MEINEIVINKLISLLSKVRDKKSDVCLFIVNKVIDINRWDLVFGGKALEGEENLKLILNLIKETFSKEEVILFSRLILFDSTKDFVKGINNAFNVESNYIKITDTTINNILIKEAYLFYSKSLK